jgi:hypothetical protein
LNKFGGYLIWRFPAPPSVFIDGRYPTVEGYVSLNDAIAQAQSTPERWSAFLSQWKIERALVSYPKRGTQDAVFDRFFPRGDWALVYWDDVALFFVRRTPKFAALIKSHEYRFVSPEASPEILAARFERSPETRAAFLQELERNRATTRLHVRNDRLRALLP